MQNIRRYSYQAIIGLLLVALSALTHAEPLLNGLAVHQELGKDQFIGAIYSDILTNDAQSLLNSDGAIRMELKITAERGIRARRFNRLWVEGIAINNGSTALSAQANNLVAFTNLFKSRLRQNDHIVFSSTPGNGIDFSINGVNLGNISDNSFIHILLSAWIGRIPLSSSYHDNLLSEGNIDGGLLQRYESITPPAQAQPVVVRTPTPRPVATAPPIAIPEPIVIAEQSEITIDLPTLGDSSTNAAEPEEETAPIEIVAEEVVPEPEIVAAIEDSVDEEDEGDENTPAFTVESLLANQQYFSNINRLVQRRIVYPRRAQQRGYTGSLRIAISLNRNGELLDSTFLERTTHKTLDSAAMKAIKRVKFPPIPEVITGTVHDFTIPITFAF